MVPGDLFHVDSLCANGKVIFAEVNAYWRPLLDVYQGGGIYATRTFPRNRPEVAALQEANRQVVEGFGLDWGASLRFNNGAGRNTCGLCWQATR